MKKRFQKAISLCYISIYFEKLIEENVWASDKIGKKMIEFMLLEVENVYRIKIFSFLPQKNNIQLPLIRLFSSTNLSTIYNFPYNYLKKRWIISEIL